LPGGIGWLPDAPGGHDFVVVGLVLDGLDRALISSYGAVWRGQLAQPITWS